MNLTVHPNVETFDFKTPQTLQAKGLKRVVTATMRCRADTVGSRRVFTHFNAMANFLGQTDYLEELNREAKMGLEIEMKVEIVKEKHPHLPVSD